MSHLRLNVFYDEPDFTRTEQELESLVDCTLVPTPCFYCRGVRNQSVNFGEETSAPPPIW